MGNSNSQQLQLDPEKYFLHRDRTWSHHQGHLIVPLTDAVIQRKMLRNTENGVILQNEGTISQRRRSMRHPDEGMFALSPSRRTLSDSDLSRTPFDHVMVPNMDSFTQKSVIAVSPSKAKIKLRKNKGKAPEPPGPPLDPRDAQRRFVRSNSSLCPRTWENEFNSLNLDRQPRCDSRNRQPVPQKSRHSRPEPNLSRSRQQEKNVNGSQKSISSLNSHRSSPRSTAAPINMKQRPPNKIIPVENSKPPRKSVVTDTPKPSPVKPQFYFSNMDALKKEPPKPTINSPAVDKMSTKPASPVVKPAQVKTTPVSTATVQPLVSNKTQSNRSEVSRAAPRPVKAEARSSLAPVSREVSNKPNSARDPIVSRIGVSANKLIPPPPPITKKLPEIPVKIESPPEARDPVKSAVRSGPTVNVSQKNNRNNKESNVGIIRPMMNDNIVFKVSPNFIVPPQCASLPQTATQILDELDATLENYSQISAERKSDDSDYCEPDERETNSRASSNTQNPVPRESGVFAPQIPTPKSLEMLFRPPSPKVLPPPTRFNGLDIISQIEMTSLPLADQPPTPPPIPSSWMKTRKNSLSSDENDGLNEINISVHLRPCLPRRPLLLASMPSRFSPTHAWKSLDPAGSDGDHHDDKSLSDCELNFSSSSSSSDEDRKEDNTLKAHLSVDSGITGGYSHPNPNQWTPKEDLIDTDSESTGGGNDLGLCSLPNQARFTLPSMFLQNSAGVDSNWSFKSGPHSLQQKSQSFVYLPPPKTSDSSVNNIGLTNSQRSLSGGRNPSLSTGVSLNIEAHDPLLEAERLREKEHKWMQKVEEEFRKRRERDRQELQEQMQLFNSLTANIRPDPEGGCDQLQVR
ncbi:rhoGEF domain-containing protein gxcI [Galendromus occidentalis]|uniref:RhoGEF domain-containing protein gxcI n=1 Tax=Galendromus occidentalis TaxID=34638 RepID=A0AAJ7P9U1_9ACAR|nr:rhoGEF domain-containing protein gxcI [Galendromus occidentalis]